MLPGIVDLPLALWELFCVSVNCDLVFLGCDVPPADTGSLVDKAPVV